MAETPRHEPVGESEERWELLRQLDALADKPLTALSFVWLILLIIDLTAGLSALLQTLTYVIWAIFILDFLVGIVIAPHKRAYLRQNWLTAISLLLPALRVLRVFRAFRLLRAARGVRSITMVRLVTTLNRGMRAIRRTLGRRGVGYVAALSLIITFAGAAGIFYFEGVSEAVPDASGAAAGPRLESYADALWFTMMLMTTLGSEYWPRTGEGRFLTLLISLYALGVFGYLAGTVASYFVETSGGKLEDAGDATMNVAASGLRQEIAALQEQLALLNARLDADETR